jgi:hypothetical protein
LYVEDMHKLPVIAPRVHVYHVISDVKFVVRKTQGSFNAVCADMVLEQTINRSQKSASGISGNTRKKKKLWQFWSSCSTKCWM